MSINLLIPNRFNFPTVEDELHPIDAYCTLNADADIDSRSWRLNGDWQLLAPRTLSANGPYFRKFACLTLT